MKKYIKPALFYENFDLTEHIAAGCEIIMKESVNPNSCVAYVGGIEGVFDFEYIFANEAVCRPTDEHKDTGVDDTDYGREEGYCYYAYDGGLFPMMES